MVEWIDFSQWRSCEELAKPGIVFEIANDDGQVIIAECGAVVSVPYDWTSPPRSFRPIPELPARRSTPLPPAIQPK
jgi:hypothetical protein